VMTLSIPGPVDDDDERELLVHAYVDRELDAAGHLNVERMIDADAGLAETVNDIGFLQKTLRREFPPEPIPYYLKSRINAAVGTSKPPMRPTWMLMAASVVAAMVLSSSSTWLALRTPATNIILAELVDGHMRALAATQPIDIVSSDRHTVKPWFQGKLPFTFDLPELAGTDFTLVGGRLVFIEREPAALLLFKYRSHFISVFVLPDSAPVSRLGDSLRKQASFNLQSWQQAGLRYVMITDAEAVHAQRLANLLQTTAGR